jgi:hypothetical protein
VKFVKHFKRGAQGIKVWEPQLYSDTRRLSWDVSLNLQSIMHHSLHATFLRIVAMGCRSRFTPRHWTEANGQLVHSYRIFESTIAKLLVFYFLESS